MKISTRALLLVGAMYVASMTQAKDVARPATTPKPTIEIRADARATGKPLVHFWSKVVGAGRANEGLRATWLEELATAHKQAGFDYIRFHGLFHDDMFVYREENGQPVYNFQYVDDLFDRILAQGMRPFVEFGFVPEELATEKNTTFWWRANGGPPTDNAKWAALVHKTVEHWVQRYGAEEVRKWYFEVWNEPNLDSFNRNGSQAQYFELYRVTANTVKGVDQQLRIGGPATSNFNLDEDAVRAAKASGKPFDALGLPWKPLWINEFLAYSKAHNLPVDFVSTHPYPQDFAIDNGGAAGEKHFRRGIDATRDDLRMLRAIIDKSAYPKAEIQLTEWNSSPSPVDHAHDSLAAAAFITKTNLESTGLVDSLSYWTFTDVFEENRKTDSVFHGGFGLINYQQIPKAAFHAYRMMNLLGDETLAQTEGSIITRDRASGRITAFAYNYPSTISMPVADTLEQADAFDASGSSRQLRIHLDRLTPGAAFTIETLDRDHGNAIRAWEAMGKPDTPTREQAQALREAAYATRKETVQVNAKGELDIDRPITPWSLVLMREQQ